MAKTRKPISIFDYTDYHLFLKEYYEESKKKNRHFSFRSFAQKAGTTASLLKDIINGRRRLTLAMANKYAAAMKLNAQEIQYFNAMVGFVNAKNNHDKNQHFNDMVRMRGRAGIQFLGQEHYGFFQHWYHSAIRELVTLPEFKNDPQWIASVLSPGITPAQARKALETLIQAGLLKVQNGQLTQHETVISSEYEMSSQVIRDFNRQMIENAKDALERIPVEKREISGLTLGVSNAMFERVKQRIRFFKEELLAMVSDDKSMSETVCQFNIQLFPLVTVDKSEGEK